jgi:hypothetical protein
MILIGKKSLTKTSLMLILFLIFSILPYIAKSDVSGPQLRVENSMIEGNLWSKKVVVYNNENKHYYNVSVSTDIPENLIDVELYRYITSNLKMKVTDNPVYNFQIIDSDGNGLTDTIKWIVPELSEVSFSVEGRLVEFDQIKPLMKTQETITVTFDRRLDCDRCGQHKAPPLTDINMTITATVSNPITNGILIDYYPVDWLLINKNDGNTSNFNSSYNKIEWNVGNVNNNIEKWYLIKSPERTLPPTKYYFFSEFGSKQSDLWFVIVSDPQEYYSPVSNQNFTSASSGWVYEEQNLQTDYATGEYGSSGGRINAGCYIFNNTDTASNAYGASWQYINYSFIVDVTNLNNATVYASFKLTATDDYIIRPEIRLVRPGGSVTQVYLGTQISGTTSYTGGWINASVNATSNFTQSGTYQLSVITYSETDDAQKGSPTTVIKNYIDDAGILFQANPRPPMFSGNTTNTTITGAPCNFTIDVTDNFPLGNTAGYIFSTNNTGSWRNASYVAFTGTGTTLTAWNVTTLNNTAGLLVQWMFYANDTSNNWNASQIYNLTTTDITPPTWSQAQDNSSYKIYRGQVVNISAVWQDNLGLSKAWLWTNETGSTGKNYTDGTYGSQRSLSGTGPTTVNFTWQNQTGSPRVIGWIIYANDTANNINGTNNPGNVIGNFTMWGWSNITWTSPSDPFNIKTIVPLTCFVNDTNTTGSGPITNYPVNFYNKTSSDESLLGTNYTNSSGYVIYYWNTTGLSAGTYYPKCNITSNSTLFYNASEFYQANTTVSLVNIVEITLSQAFLKGIIFGTATPNTMNNPAINNTSGSSGETEYNVTVGSSSTNNIDFYVKLNQTFEAGIIINETSSTNSGSSGFSTNTTISDSWSLLGNTTSNCTSITNGNNCWIRFYFNVSNVPSGYKERTFKICGVITGSNPSICG